MYKGNGKITLKVGCKYGGKLLKCLGKRNVYTRVNLKQKQSSQRNWKQLIFVLITMDNYRTFPSIFLLQKEVDVFVFLCRHK